MILTPAGLLKRSDGQNPPPLCFRLLLWDCDERSYSYYIEVSTDQQHWVRVVDRTKVACRYGVAFIFVALIPDSGWIFTS